MTAGRALVLAAVAAALVFASSFTYEFLVGSGWPVQELPGPHSDAGSYQLVQDSAEEFRLAYIGTSYDGHYTLCYGEMTADGAWKLSYLSELGYWHEGASLALDSQDGAYICTYSNYGPHVVFATNAGGEWEVETINVTGVLTAAEVAVDEDDVPHILYTVEPPATDYPFNSSLVEMVRTSQGWESTVLIQCGDMDTVWMNDLKTCPDGSMSLVYTRLFGTIHYWDQWSSAHVNYSVLSDGRLTDSTTITDFGPCEGEMTLCHDSSGNAYVCTYWRQDYGFSLSYFTNADGAWNRSDVAYAGNAYPSGTSVSVDADDRLHFGYFVYYSDDETSNHTARYCTDAEGTWDVRILARAGSTMESIAVLPDADGHIHIIFKSQDDDGYSITKYTTSQLDPDRHYNEIYVSGLRAAAAGVLVAAVLLLVMRRQKMRDKRLKEEEELGLYESRLGGQGSGG